MFVFVLVCITLCLFLFSITLKRKRELIALHLLSFGCLVIVNVLWLFLMVLWDGLKCVIVVFPDHTHLLLYWGFRNTGYLSLTSRLIY